MSTTHPDLNYVGMGVHICPVCLKEHDEVVLIDKCLRPTLKRRNFVGWALCTEHEELWQNGYIALIECTNSQQTTLEGAERTGAVAHVRKEVWPHIFNTPVPNTPIAFVQQGVIDRLQAMVSKENSPCASG
jgi:hypothetical protein